MSGLVAPGVVMDAEGRHRLVDRFGPGVAGWCDALPELVEGLAARWRLRVLAAMPGGTARTFACRRPDGTRVVLKLTPERDLAAIEAVALEAWAATPYMVGLLDADLDAGALLLEWIGQDTPRSLWGRDLPLSEIAGLLQAIRVFQRSAGTERLPSLQQRMQFLHAITRRRLERLPTPLPQVVELLDRSLAPTLALAGEGPPMLVHGDLHPGNVLDGGAGRGLVAIDPRPCLGDPTVDAIDWVAAFVGSLDEMERRIARLAELVDGLDAERLWRWCQAVAAMIAASHLRHQQRPPTVEVMLRLAGELP